MTTSIHRLDEVCAVTMGQAPKGESYNSTGDGWPLIAGAGDFQNGLPRAKKFTSEPSKLSAPGDIVVGIRASIGDKVIADREYCLGRGVAGLRPGAKLDLRYLWHWLTDSAPILALKGRGATFKQVSRQDLGEMEIPLPALEEQRGIAEILDRADGLRAMRRQALANLDELTQSIFLDMFAVQSPGSELRRVALPDAYWFQEGPGVRKWGPPAVFMGGLAAPGTGRRG